MNAASGRTAPFPWRHAMAVGLGLMRLAPDDFWSMTPREFAAATAFLTGPGRDAPERPAFEALMRRFPDETAR